MASSSTKLNSSNASPPQWNLTLRLDRPIVGSTLIPYSHLTIKGAQFDNATRGKIIDSNPHAFRYRWSKSLTKNSCLNTHCNKTDDKYNPTDWTNYRLGGPSLLCSYCVKYNSKLPHRFCSKR